jgi:hypothetical protein
MRDTICSHDTHFIFASMKQLDEVMLHDLANGVPLSEWDTS